VFWSLLYLTVEQGELRFRLAICVAKLLGRNREEVFSFVSCMKHLYVVRSSFLHAGNVEKLDWQEFFRIDGDCSSVIEESFGG